jgi:hypothetical protein
MVLIELSPAPLPSNVSCSNSHILYMQIEFLFHKIYTRYSLIPAAYLLGSHAAYLSYFTFVISSYYLWKTSITLYLSFSNFPSINGFIGNWSFSTFSFVNMSADCWVSSSSDISMPISLMALLAESIQMVVATIKANRKSMETMLHTQSKLSNNVIQYSCWSKDTLGLLTQC